MGLAMQTPSSGVAVVGKSRIKSTPGSGEALLRGQVKNLLQKVEEEEAHLITKISVESRPFIHLVTSPMGLLAPTPANTPKVLDGAPPQVVIASPVVSEQLRAAAAASQVKLDLLCMNGVGSNSIEMIGDKRLFIGPARWRKKRAWRRVRA